MKVLITGSTGTLGQPLRKELESRGHDVWGMDLAHGEQKIMRGDISEYRQVKRVFDAVQPEVVYNLAAEFGRWNGQHFYEQLWRSNTIGVRNVIDACVAQGAHLIHASSSEAYGDAADLGSLHEDMLLTHVPSFHNEYALSKWTGEKQIEIAMRNDGLSTTILRYFNAFGPGENYNDYRSVVCLFIYRLMKGLPITVYKDYHRVFMYVDDWARTVANVTDTFKTGYDGHYIFNVGGTYYCSVEELVERIVNKLDGTTSQITLLPKEKANITNKRPDISRAAYYLKHECKVGLDDGLDKTIAWMKAKYGTETVLA